MGQRYRRKFKSGCTPIFLDVVSADPQRLFLLLYIYIYIYIYLFIYSLKKLLERHQREWKKMVKMSSGS